MFQLCSLTHTHSPDSMDDEEYSPIHVASRKGHTAIIVALVEEGGADINVRGGEQGDTPLMLSVRSPSGLPRQNWRRGGWAWFRQSLSQHQSLILASSCRPHQSYTISIEGSTKPTCLMYAGESTVISIVYSMYLKKVWMYLSTVEVSCYDVIVTS